MPSSPGERQLTIDKPSPRKHVYRASARARENTRSDVGNERSAMNSTRYTRCENASPATGYMLTQLGANVARNTHSFFSSSISMNICEPVAGEAMLSCWHHHHHHQEKIGPTQATEEDRQDKTGRQKDRNKRVEGGKGKHHQAHSFAMTNSLLDCFRSPRCRSCAAQAEFHCELSLLAIPPRRVSTPLCRRKKRPSRHFAFDQAYRSISLHQNPRHATLQRAFIFARPLRHRSLQGSTVLTTST